MIRKPAIFLLAAQAIFLVGVGCKHSANKPQAYTQIDPATAGAIVGTIHVTGAVPAPVKINVSQDPGCVSAGQPPDFSKEYVVHDGKMANVFLYLKAGPPGSNFAPPRTPVVIDQKGCQYLPHVVGVMVGQRLDILNSDPTMHDVNVQPAPGENAPSDATQGPHGKPVSRTFSKPETMIPLRCNVHPWMEAFINVAPTPFFAVSGQNGSYTIRGVPPGTYTLAADQEKLGSQEQTVTVHPRQSSIADFTFHIK